MASRVDIAGVAYGGGIGCIRQALDLRPGQNRSGVILQSARPESVRSPIRVKPFANPFGGCWAASILRGVGVFFSLNPATMTGAHFS